MTNPKTESLDTTGQERALADKLIEAQAIVSCMSHRDDCTSSADHPDMCGCGLTQLDRVLRLPADLPQTHAERALEKAAALAEYGFRCRTCGVVFDGHDGHPAPECDHPSWDRLTDAETASAIRALPHQPATDEGEGIGWRIDPAYTGPVVSFDFNPPYYLSSCDKCGWVGSSEHCGLDSGGDDSDVYCPRCHSPGADCGKVADRIPSTPPSPAAETRLREAVVHLCDAVEQNQANGYHVVPTIVRAAQETRAALTQPEPTAQQALPQARVDRRHHPLCGVQYGHSCDYDCARDYTPPAQQGGEEEGRLYPQLLDDGEGKALLTRAEQLWADLQANNLGGFSGINRPFYILHEFKRVIEQFGNRDVGLNWSKDQLDAALSAQQAVDEAECRRILSGLAGYEISRADMLDDCSVLARYAVEAMIKVASAQQAAGEAVAWMYEKGDRTCIWRERAGPGDLSLSREETVEYVTELWNARTLPAAASAEAGATSDSDDYRHTFYGILNAQGKFWTPLPFHDEEAAKAHLARFAIGSNKSMLDTHSIVPVRVRLSLTAKGKDQV